MPVQTPPILGAEKPRTLREAIELIEADESLTSSRRCAWASALRSYGRYLGRGPELRIDYTLFRQLEVQAHPDWGGHITPKTWSNIRSSVKAALRHLGIGKRPCITDGLSRKWNDLRKRLTDRSLRYGSSRFISWCSVEGISPDDVDDRVLHAFYNHLQHETTVRNPKARYRETCKIWNSIATVILGRPNKVVTVPSFRDTISLPDEAFPNVFWDDVDRYQLRMSGQDLLAEDAPDKPLKLSTLDHHRKQFRRCASALVHSGFPIERITSITVLVDVENLEAILRFYLKRLGGPRPSLFEIAATLVAVARHYVVVSEDHLEELQRLKGRLKCRPRGFTEKNRERVRQLLDPRNRARFLGLADNLIALARKRESDHKAALLVQSALLHEILLTAPMRFGNAVNLNLQEHLQFSRPGRSGKVTIAIPAEEVKNEEELVFPLPDRVARLLRLYLDRYRPPLLSDSNSDQGWLFPGRNGGPKHEVSLRHQLCTAVRRHAGLIVNPHLYRHIAAFFYLKAHPGDYETVRRLLGHKSMETTIAFYTEYERLTAVEHYNRVILEEKDQLDRRFGGQL